MGEEVKYQNNELRNSILVFVDYIKELFRKWYVYLILGLIFCGLAYLYLNSRKTTYEARMTFMTNSGGSGKAGNLLKMASTFGLNLGGGSSGGGLNASKLAELLISHRILKKTLLSNVVIDGDTALMVNHYQRLFVEESQIIKEVLPEENGEYDFESLSVRQNSVLNKTIEQIKRSGLGVSTSDNEIVRVIYETGHEAYTQKFITRLVNNLSEFYTSRAVEQQQETNNMLQFRVDSLSQLLLNKEAALRAWLNKYTLRIGSGSLTPDEFLTKSRLEREAEVTSNLYKESIVAHELSKVDLDASKPIIQIIDYPVLPLTQKYPIPLIFYGFALFCAFIIATVIILFWKLIRDALKVENNYS